MEKVLVLALFSDPSTVTGVQRTRALTLYLHQFGYFPILITRNWDTAAHKKDIETEHTATYSSYKLNLDNNLTERINTNFKGGKAIFRKAFNMLGKVLLSLGSSSFFEYRAIMKQAQAILENEQEIKKVIVIADPFPFFFIGYKLKKNYGIKWIADYRDAWNTVEFSDTYNQGSSRLKQTLESHNEKKWVGSATYITSVSDYYTKRISSFVNVPGETIYNGFFQDTVKSEKKESSVEKFIIVHNGSIYPTQSVEIFLEGFKKFIDKAGAVPVELLFVGAKVFKDTDDRINNALAGYERYYSSTDRIPQQQLFDVIDEAALLLMVSHGKQLRGVTSSKVFEYLLAAKPVLCCPTDHDVVEQILTSSGQGFFADSASEVAALLQQLYTEFIEKGRIDINYNKEAVNQYTRENQTRKIAALLDKM